MEELYLTLQPVQGTSFLCGLPGHLHILGAAILLEVSASNSTQTRGIRSTQVIAMAKLSEDVILEY